MALEDYNLGTLRAELKQEFGVRSSDTSRDTFFNDKINAAIYRIVNARDGIWPWQLRDLVIDVSPSSSGVGDFTQGSSTFVWTSGTKPSLRDVVSVGTGTGDLTSGYTVTDVSGDPNFVLDANYLGESEAGASYRVAAAAYQLPDDFKKMRNLFDVVDQFRALCPVSIEQLELLRRGERIYPGLASVYAVQTDPLGPAHSSYSSIPFLVVYPYPGQRTTLRGQYIADPQALSSDSDIPIIPRSERRVVYDVAAELLAATFREAQLNYYTGIARESLQMMERSYDYISPFPEEAYHQRLSFLQHPAYPEFRET